MTLQREAACSVLLGLLTGSLLGIAARLAFFVLAISLLRGLAAPAPAVLDSVLWIDPVYTRAAVRDLGEVRIQGIAVQGPLGQVLHQTWPWLMVDPSRAHSALVRVVLEPGSAQLGRLTAASFANAGVVGLGLLLVTRGWRSRRSAMLVGGVAVQAQVALAIVGMQPSVHELETTGLAFAANALLPWLWQRSMAVGDALAGTPRPLLEAPPVTADSPPMGAPPAPQPVLADVQPIAPPSSLLPITASDRWFDELQRGPSRVEVIGTAYNYQLLENGRPLVIRGMGLNTQYRTFLSPEERVARLDADMAAYRALGVNTVLDWDPAEFDEVLLDAARRHGIGVIPPFDLDPEADYTDPEVRQALRDQVVAWVLRYRSHPGLRMWGLGNEVLHKIVHPAWVGPQDPARERNAEAFSDWLIETADEIHALDPNHPVTYRSAEDAFVPWVVDAIHRRGGGPRPWFVWGTNCYQDYLREILDNWPESGLDSAIWVSEFAPGTLAVPDRPDGFAAMWSAIRSHPDWVLGGAVYAWTRHGPEGVDRNSGLTDDGVPVDGRSLDMLTELFHAEP
jgi:hypothetical protein